MSTHSLSNIENYRTDSSDTSSEVFVRFLNLSGEYIIQCMDNIHMRNVRYYEYILNRGLLTLSHVFKTLYLYTRNLDLTVHHCQKAIYYYVEFIGQIGDDHHSFLQLNSKDAILFVYKKTIFEIDSGFRKEFASPKHPGSVLSNVDLLIKIYIHIFQVSMSPHISQNNNLQVNIINNNTRLHSISKVIINLWSTNEVAFGEKLNIIDTFVLSLLANADHYLVYVETFIKKLKKKPCTLEHLNSKLHYKNHTARFDALLPTKYINWIFSTSS